jgi:hypothetical protein
LGSAIIFLPFFVGDNRIIAFAAKSFHNHKRSRLQILLLDYFL